MVDGGSYMDHEGPRREVKDIQFIGRIRAAAYLDVNVQTLDRLIREGRLRAFCVGRRVVVLRDELVRLMQSSEI